MWEDSRDIMGKGTELSDQIWEMRKKGDVGRVL